MQEGLGAALRFMTELSAARSQQAETSLRKAGKEPGRGSGSRQPSVREDKAEVKKALEENRGQREQLEHADLLAEDQLFFHSFHKTLWSKVSAWAPGEQSLKPGLRCHYSGDMMLGRE